MEFQRFLREKEERGYFLTGPSDDWIQHVLEYHKKSSEAEIIDKAKKQLRGGKNVKEAYDESKHSRMKKGSPKGGQFSKRGAVVSPESKIRKRPRRKSEHITARIFEAWDEVDRKAFRAVVLPKLPEERFDSFDAKELQAKMHMLDDSVRIKTKEKIAMALSNKTGYGEDAVADVIREWAAGTSQRSMSTRALQYAAVEALPGAKFSEWQTEKFSTPPDRDYDYDLAWHDPESPTFQADYEEDLSNRINEGGRQPIIRAMYDKTQEELKAAGIESMVLYRGLQSATSAETTLETKRHSLREEARLDQSALASWSVSPSVAQDFTYGKGSRGIVIAAVFPRERILSTAQTGFGCLFEGEVVVIGNGKILNGVVTHLGSSYGLAYESYKEGFIRTLGSTLIHVK